MSFFRYSPCLIWSARYPGSASAPPSWSVPPAPPSSALQYNWREGPASHTSCLRTTRWWTRRALDRTASACKPTMESSESNKLKQTVLRSVAIAVHLGPVCKVPLGLLKPPDLDFMWSVQGILSYRRFTLWLDFHRKVVKYLIFLWILSRRRKFIKKEKPSQQTKRNQNKKTTAKQKKFKDLMFRVIIQYWSIASRAHRENCTDSAEKTLENKCIKRYFEIIKCLEFRALGHFQFIPGATPTWQKFTTLVEGLMDYSVRSYLGIIAGNCKIYPGFENHAKSKNRDISPAKSVN